MFNTCLPVPTFHLPGKALLTTLINFDWRLVELIFSSDEQYQRLGYGVQTVLSGPAALENNVTITRYVDNAEGEDPDEESILRIYRTLKKEARSKLPV